MSNTERKYRAVGVSSSYPDIYIDVANGKLTAKFFDEPLLHILWAMQKLMDLEYQAPAEVLDIRISRNFEKAPIDRALKEILDPFDYVHVHDKDRHSYNVSILGVKQGQGTLEVRSSAPSTTEELQGPPKEILELWEKRRKKMEERRRSAETRDEITVVQNTVASDLLQEPPAELLDLLKKVGRKYKRKESKEDAWSNSRERQ